MPDFDDLFATAYGEVKDRNERRKSWRGLAVEAKDIMTAFEKEGFSHTESTEWAMMIVGQALGVAFALGDEELPE